MDDNWDPEPGYQTYRRTLVTGASGWLGRRFVHRFANLDRAQRECFGSSLRLLVPAGESVRDLTDVRSSIVGGDIADPSALRALVDDAEDGLLVHIAGLVHPRLFTSDFDRINVEGTRSLLEAAKSARVRRLVFVSSNSPFGANPSPDHVFDEDSSYNPYMSYGRSKYRAERILLEHARRGVAPEIVVCRAPWFYGPGQPERQTLFFRMIRRGRFPIVGSGRNRRSMGYVDSLADGLMRAAMHPQAAGEVYWLADEQPYEMAQIITTIKKLMQDEFDLPVATRTPRLPGTVSDLARAADWALQAIGLYHQKIHVLSEMNLTIACDVSKARRELGYRPIVGLEEGMRRSIQWCIEQGIRL